MLHRRNVTVDVTDFRLRGILPSPPGRIRQGPSRPTTGARLHRRLTSEGGYPSLPTGGREGPPASRLGPGEYLWTFSDALCVSMGLLPNSYRNTPGDDPGLYSNTGGQLYCSYEDDD